MNISLSTTIESLIALLEGDARLQSDEEVRAYFHSISPEAQLPGELYLGELLSFFGHTREKVSRSRLQRDFSKIATCLAGELCAAYHVLVAGMQKRRAAVEALTGHAFESAG